MKQFKNISILLSSIFALALFTVSCEDDSEVFTVNETAPVILSDLSITMIELDQNNVNNPAVTFNWNQADYGQQASENYTVQVSSDHAFTDPVTAITVTGTNSATLSVNELNSAAGSAGLPPFVWNTLYARVVSSLGTQNGLPVSSNTINFEVFPFFNYAFTDYYLVGDATAPGWENNNNNPPLYRDPNNSNLYYYTGRFADNGHFKVLITKGLWQPQWGTNAATENPPETFTGNVEANLGDSDDPERFPYGGGDGIPEGFYRFTIDFGSNTFIFEPFDTSSAVDYTSITVQGSSLPSDVTLTQSSFDGHIWFANGITLQPGDAQFVTNTGSSWGSTTEFSGQAIENGGAIPVIVGDQYDIWYNDLSGRYILIPQNL